MCSHLNGMEMTVSAFYESHLSNNVIKTLILPPMIKKKLWKYSLHDASSEPSVQSLFPSHIHASGMHSPLLLLHVKSSDEHTFTSARINIMHIRVYVCVCVHMRGEWGKEKKLIPKKKMLVMNYFEFFLFYTKCNVRNVERK